MIIPYIIWYNSVHAQKSMDWPVTKWWVPYLGIQLHDVGHLVPAEAHEPPVVLWGVPPHHDVRLKVRLPLHVIGRGGRPPFGKVGGSVAFSPYVVPERR